MTHPTANPGLDGASTAPRGAHERLATASESAVKNGMQVRSESGELLGRVASIIPGDARNESYVVVGDLQGLATLMPYETATAMTRRDALVVDRDDATHGSKSARDGAEVGLYVVINGCISHRRGLVGGGVQPTKIAAGVAALCPTRRPQRIGPLDHPRRRVGRGDEAPEPIGHLDLGVRAVEATVVPRK